MNKEINCSTIRVYCNFFIFSSFTTSIFASRFGSMRPRGEGGRDGGMRGCKVK
jgi:hypothetical protein